MRSIRNQLLGYLIPGVLLIAVGSGIGLYAYMDEVLEHAMDSALAAKAEAIVAAVHMEEDGKAHLLTTESSRSTPPRHDDPFYFQLFHADGRTLARAVPPSIGDAALPAPHNPHRRFGDEWLPDRTAVRVTRMDFIANPDEDAFDPAQRSAAPAGEHLTLIVARDRRSIDQTLAVLLGGLAGAAAVMTGGVIAVIGFGVRRSLRPLAHVSIIADQIDASSLNIRFPAGHAVPLELRPISGKLNNLLDRVAAAFDREKRFSAAVAHELRTPLAELQSACEVALRWPDDSASATAALTDSLGIAHDMTVMVRNLLALARAGAGVEKINTHPVSLEPLINEICGSVQPTIDARQIGVDRYGEAGLHVAADIDLLKAVLRNLIENAVEHSPAGGKVLIRSSAVDAAVVLIIGNTCDTLTRGDLPKLFEPFWQKSQVRSSRSHSGLGLSIVEAYCKAMGVPIVMTLNDTWLEATMTFVST